MKLFKGPYIEKGTVLKKKLKSTPLRDTISISIKCLETYIPSLVTPSSIWKPYQITQPPITKMNKVLKNRNVMSYDMNKIMKFGSKGFFFTIMRGFSSKIDQVPDISIVNFNHHIELTKKTIVSEIKKETKEEPIVEFSEENGNWEATVVNSEAPVVVDCYADWCAPCKKLLPVILKKHAESGNFKLVKVNIDNNQTLAENLNISSIPAVFLIYKGNIVDNFVGIPQQKRLDEFFNSITLLQGIGKDETIFQGLLLGSEELMKKKQYQQAINMLNEAFSHEKWRKKYGYLIKLGLSICYYNETDFSKATQHIEELNSFHSTDLTNDKIAKRKLAHLQLKINLKPTKRSVDTILQELKDNKSLDVRFELAEALVTSNDFTNAITELLEIIRIDKNWSNKKANILLLQIFEILGGDNSLVIEGRKKLTKILY